jgi:hypothetical protein
MTSKIRKGKGRKANTSMLIGDSQSVKNVDRAREKGMMLGKK